MEYTKTKRYKLCSFNTSLVQSPNPHEVYNACKTQRSQLHYIHICDRFWENPYKRCKYHYSISSVLVISLIFVKIFFIMKMDVWNIVLGPGKDIRSGTHYNSRSKPNTVLKFLTSRAASIRKTGTRP